MTVMALHMGQIYKAEATTSGNVAPVLASLDRCFYIYKNVNKLS